MVTPQGTKMALSHRPVIQHGTSSPLIHHGACIMSSTRLNLSLILVFVICMSIQCLGSHLKFCMMILLCELSPRGGPRATVQHTQGHPPADV
jgi:hypothetical protein